jgi:predicted permease
MVRDLRLAARMLLHAKGWTAVVILSLALGIGANTALFSAMDGMLLTKLSVREPDSLVRIRYAGRNDMVTDSSDYGFSAKTVDGLDVRTTFSYPMYLQFLTDNRTMTDLVASAPQGQVSVIVDGTAELARAFVSSGNYYQVLGVNARLGRTITPQDDRPSAPPVAVISSRYWHVRFGSDPAVVGKTVKVNDAIVTVVGVLPPEFSGIQQPLAEAPDIWLPLSVVPQIDVYSGPGAPLLQRPTYWWLQLMGRLKPGATTAQVQANLEGVFQRTARAGLDSYLKSLPEADRALSQNAHRTEVPRLLVDSGARGYYDANSNEVRSLAILMTVVALVLLIVCANVANLLLSRSVSRQKEISVRLSLGATRARLVRQLLTESVLLSILGGAAGLLVAYWGRQLLPGTAARGTMLDWRVLLFLLAVTAATGVLFGIAPALRGTGGDVNASLKETSRSVSGARSLLGKALLVAQVAISLVLLIAAALFLQTLSNLRHVDVGFNPKNLLLFRVNPTLNHYDSKEAIRLYHDMLDRLAALPGVRGVAMSQPALLAGSISSTGFFVQGHVYASGREAARNNSVNRLIVSPNFSDVMGIPLVLGRALTDRDDATAPKVAVINEAAVRKYFPNENPIGRRFGTGGPETSGQIEIVGVLRDAKYNSVRDPAPPTMYMTYAQGRLSGSVFEVRTAGRPSSVVTSIREAVRQIDPNLPVTNVSTQIEEVERRFGQEKLFAQACTIFGSLALLIAAVGLYGLMSYSVSRRTNEIGIRMALGADRTQVLGLVMRESMILVAAGAAIGLAAALAVGGTIASLLFGLPPRDVTTFAGATLVMVAVSALAGFLPARRASNVDPMVALRYE